MGLGKKYMVPFAGLKPGTHHFEFELEDAFFKAYDVPEVKEGRMMADLQLIRQSTMLVLEFTISGTFKTECDRCGIPCTLPVEGTQQLIVKLGDDESNSDGEVISLPSSEAEIDIAPYLQEYVQLSLPVRKVACEVLEDDSLCDREMLKKLEKFSEGEEEKKADERWDKLKNIKIK